MPRLWGEGEAARPAVASRRAALADAEGVGAPVETTDPFLQEAAQVWSRERGSSREDTGLRLLGCCNNVPLPSPAGRSKVRELVDPGRGKSLLPVFPLSSQGGHRASSPVSSSKDLNPITTSAETPQYQRSGG